MRDLLPDEAENLRFIEQTARELSKLYGYREVITPIVEHYEVSAAKIGEETRKRMYVFEDLGGRKVTLRPEFTASVAKLVVAKMQSTPKPIRLFSTGTLYRYDEPQFGRYREFWQANIELFGSSKPDADAEILTLTDDFLKKIGIRNYHFKIGHVGILRGVLKQEGITEEQQNGVMQLLDKKQWADALEIVQEAGVSQECLDNLEAFFKIRGKDPDTVTREISEVVKGYSEALEATKNLSEILGLLEAAGLEVDPILEAGFARGLEYYTGIIFEVYVPEMNIALGGGGRYDRLIELFGGGRIPAVGVASGIDRLLLALEKQGKVLRTSKEERILVISVGDEMAGEAFRVSSLLRKDGCVSEVETMGRSVSKALSDADRRGITHAVIVAPREMGEGKVVLRHMKERTQEKTGLKNLVERIRR
jgi:histidyl-tRNA synthetase